jgi:hypothetical protein
MSAATASGFEIYIAWLPAASATLAPAHDGGVRTMSAEAYAAEHDQTVYLGACTHKIDRMSAVTCQSGQTRARLDCPLSANGDITPEKR